MTIHERMIPRTEREKDLLKYGRSQERERIIKLLEEHLCTFTDTEIIECWCGSFIEAITIIKENK